MKQQINLYAAPPESNVWRDYSPFPQVALGLVLIMLVLTLFAGMEQRNLQAELDALNAQQAEQMQKLEALQQSMPSPLADTALEAQVGALQRSQTARTRLLQALVAEQVGNERGFSGYLEGLARQQIQGLWLTHIELSDGGVRMGLEGMTGKPEFVPQLLQSLASESVFRGVQFDIFNLALAEQGKAAMSFSVRAEQDKKPQGETD